MITRRSFFGGILAVAALPGTAIGELKNAAPLPLVFTESAWMQGLNGWGYRAMGECGGMIVAAACQCSDWQFSNFDARAIIEEEAREGIRLYFREKLVLRGPHWAGIMWDKNPSEFIRPSGTLLLRRGQDWTAPPIPVSQLWQR